MKFKIGSLCKVAKHAEFLNNIIPIVCIRKKNSLSRPNSDEQLKNPTFLPFNELNERVKQISKEINELKYDDKDVARLTLAESVIFDLREQSNNIKLLISRLRDFYLVQI